MKPYRLTLFVLLCVTLVLVACGSSAEDVALAVSQTVEARPPEVVEQPVEVTRIVEVEKEVEKEVEVEVTRLVEVETEVEVTRVVEVIVTATPTATPEPSPTPEPQPTAATASDASDSPAPASAGGDVNARITAHIETTYQRAIFYRGVISGPINCDDEIATFNQITAVPAFDVASASPEVQSAYQQYLQGVQVFQNGTTDLHTHCQDFLANPAESSTSVTRDKYGFAVTGADEAITILANAIRTAGGTVP